MNSRVKVPFYGDTIEAIKTEDSKVFVSLKRVCLSLGVDVNSQRQKLANCAWATTAIITAVAEDGKSRQLTMIDLESLPMWLVTINPGKVAPEIREKLVRYQKEAKAVLSAWFLGMSSDFPALAAEFAKLKADFGKLETKVDGSSYLVRLHKSRNTILKDEFREQTETMNVVMQPFASRYCEHLTIKDYCKKYGVVDENGKPLSRGMIAWAGRAVSGMMAALGYHIPTPGGSNFYRIDVLQAWRVGHDMKTKTGSASVGNLFDYGSHKTLTPLLDN